MHYYPILQMKTLRLSPGKYLWPQVPQLRSVRIGIMTPAAWAYPPLQPPLGPLVFSLSL